jgi:hypothetical protein
MGKGMRLFNIWRTPDAGSEPSKVNGKPLRALSFDQAVICHLAASDDPFSYRRRPDGSWVHAGARLFESRSDAATAAGQAS